MQPSYGYPDLSVSSILNVGYCRIGHFQSWKNLQIMHF